MTRGVELERVRLEGKRVRTASLDVRAATSLQPFPRVGFVVPRYTHGTVDRNRVKRRLREIARLELLPLLNEHPALDVVIRAFPGAYRRHQQELATEVAHAMRRLLRS